jgi:monofunctional biosynthetic peptidoglycan transglycosylase
MWMHKIRTVLFGLGIYIAAEVLTIPYLDIALLAYSNPEQTALMRQRLDEAEDQGKKLTISQRWIPASTVPRFALDAIVVAEDGTFFEHRGLDWFEIKESFERNFREGRAVRGASTITQQLAKNLYLSTSKTPVRKLKEVIITFLLERHLTKRRILELYVNVIEWGRGVFGIEAASRAYFGKSARALTFDEAVRLAAVIPSPLTHRPDANSRYVLRRKQIVLNRLHGRSNGQIAPVPDEPLELTPATTPVVAEDTTVIDSLEDDPDGF